MARLFAGGAGSDQQIILSPGGVTSDGGPLTVLTLWRPIASHDGVLVSGIASSSSTWGYLQSGTAYFTNGDFSGFGSATAGTWQVIGYSKATGSAAVRWHHLTSPTGSWTHTNGSTIADQGAPTSLWIGNGQGGLGGLRLQGAWLLTAIWNTVLADATLDGAPNLLRSLQAWVNLAPAELLVGDQRSTSVAVTSITGTAAEGTVPSTASPPAILDSEPLNWQALVGAAPSTPYKIADRAAHQELTSSTTTTVDMPLAGSIAVGSVLIARLAMDNSGTDGAATTCSISDPRGNTWTVGAAANRDPGAANAGISCRIAYCVVANGYTNGDDLTITYGNATPADAIVVEEWANLDTSNLVAVAQQTATGGSATPSVSITPGGSGQLVYGALAIEGPGGDTYTQDSDTTDGVWTSLTGLATTSGTAASNALIRGGYKLVSGTTAQTWNPGIANRDWAAVAIVFNPAPAGGPVGLDGTGEAANSATGTANVARAVAGSAPATAGASGQLTTERGLAGTASSANSAVGTLRVTRSLVGVSPAAGDAAGSAATGRSFAGVTSSAGDATGALASRRSFAGSGRAASTVTGSLTSTRAVAGEAQAAGDATGEIARTRSFTGTAPAAGDGTANLAAARPLAGSSPSAAAAAGSMRTARALMGIAPAACSATGDLALAGQVSLTGTSAAAGSAHGTLTGTRRLVGLGSAAGATTAALTVTSPALVALTGTAPAAALAVGRSAVARSLAAVATAAGWAAGALTVTGPGPPPLVTVGVTAGSTTALVGSRSSTARTAVRSTTGEVTVR